MDFSDLAEFADAAIENALCDDAGFRKSGGSEWSSVHIMFERPLEAQKLEGVSIVRARPTVDVRVASVSALAVKDEFLYGGRIWRVAAAPTRPGDGTWWHAEVEDVGAP